MDSIKPLLTATATAVGGRNGHTETTDGVVKADLLVPKEMGDPGKPGAATPEHLFAAGYAACFGSSLDFVATQKKRDGELWMRLEDQIDGTNIAVDLSDGLTGVFSNNDMIDGIVDGTFTYTVRV